MTNKRGASVLLYIVCAVAAVVCVAAVITLLSGVAARRGEQRDFESLYNFVALPPPAEASAPAGSAPSQSPGSSTDTEAAPSESPAAPDPLIHLPVDVDKLAALNPDCIGWLSIDGTTVNHPVMFTPDDEERYIHLSFDGDYSNSGCLFADADSVFDPQGDNIIIYGHNTSVVTMFAQLFEYENEEFYRKYSTITFDTVYGRGTYQVMAVFRTNLREVEEDAFRYYTFSNAGSEDEFDDFVDNVKALSLYDTSVTAKYGDRLITLSTCAYHTANGRFVVVAKRI